LPIPSPTPRASWGCSRRETPLVDPVHWGYLTLALTERGECDEPEEAITRSGCGPDLPPLTYMGTPSCPARLHLAQGRPEDALVDLLELDARDERLGIEHLRIPWHREAVDACLAVDDTDRAVHFADRLLELARSRDTPAARGRALSARGLASQGEDRIDLPPKGGLCSGSRRRGSTPLGRTSISAPRCAATVARHRRGSHCGSGSTQPARAAPPR
jgi:hypothetical protein